jgi:hypothetical protein
MPVYDCTELGQWVLQAGSGIEFPGLALMFSHSVFRIGVSGQVGFWSAMARAFQKRSAIEDPMGGSGFRGW